MRTLLTLTVVTLMGTSVAVPAVGPQQQSSAPVVPSIFQPFYRGPLVSEDRAKAVRAALPYESIGLELSGGMLVPGGLFRLTLQRDGSAQVWTDGANKFGPAGDYVGTVSLFDFGKLSHLIAEAGFERFSPRYAVRWSDMQEITVSVQADARTVVVADYGGAGPVQLWALQRAIEVVGLNIHWKPK